jgi:hypothetical protein
MKTVGDDDITNQIAAKRHKMRKIVFETSLAIRIP